jgi:hypothetical protein
MSATMALAPRRRALGLLALIFLGPLAAAFLLYYGAPGLRPLRSTAHGELLNPARPLAAIALLTPSGTRTDPLVLENKWSLVALAEERCSASCAASLDQARQIRLLLTHDAARVQRVLLYTRACCGDPPAAAPDLTIASLQGPDAAPLREVFLSLPVAGLYVVDPHGNLFMHYPPTVAASGVLEDLKRLLKLSHIG